VAEKLFPNAPTPFAEIWPDITELPTMLNPARFRIIPLDERSEPMHALPKTDSLEPPTISEDPIEVDRPISTTPITVNALPVTVTGPSNRAISLNVDVPRIEGDPATTFD
jgi:hypothetical protein